MSGEDGDDGSAAWIAAARTVFLKDLRAELRTRVAFSAIGVFTFAALMLLGLATAALRDAQAFNLFRFYDAFNRVHQSTEDPALRQVLAQSLSPAWTDSSKLALLWVLLCFAAFTGLAHSFVHEEEAGTALALRLSTSSGAVYAGKLTFNGLLIGLVAALVTPVYMLMTGMRGGNVGALLGTMVSGCVGLAGAATIIAALAAKARGTGALYGALGLPLLVVFVSLLINAANAVYAPGATLIEILRGVGGLLSYGVALIAVSSITFRFVWEE